MRSTTAALAVALALGAACSGGAGRSGSAPARARTAAEGAARPNVVWIVAADSRAAAGAVPGLGAAVTVSETVAVASGPAAVRAALLTGATPAALGVDEASGRFAAPPPAGVAVLPELLRRAGYYTSRAGPPGHRLAVGRTDPVGIVHVDGGVHAAARGRPVPAADLAQPGLLGAWDAAGPDADWRGREKDWESPCTVSFGCGGPRQPGARPFFAMFNPPAGGEPDPAGRVRRIVAALAADGLLEDTAVFLIGADGAASTVAVRWPAARADAGAPDVPIGPLDLAPTALALAGAPPPAYMEGRALAGPGRRPRPIETGSEEGRALAGSGRRARPAVTGAAAERGRAGVAAAPASSPLPAGRRAGVAATPASAPLSADQWADVAAAPASSLPAGAPVAATPGGYPTGGLFHVAPRVDLRCDTAGSTIVYTTEREAPFHWRLYTGPFRMRFWTLRFQCGRLGYGDSDVVTFDFDIE